MAADFTAHGRGLSSFAPGKKALDQDLRYRNSFASAVANCSD
jgi:hypothetical protein